MSDITAYLALKCHHTVECKKSKISTASSRLDVVERDDRVHRLPLPERLILQIRPFNFKTLNEFAEVVYNWQLVVSEREEVVPRRLRATAASAAALLGW